MAKRLNESDHQRPAKKQKLDEDAAKLPDNSDTAKDERSKVEKREAKKQKRRQREETDQSKIATDGAKLGQRVAESRGTELGDFVAPKKKKKSKADRKSQRSKSVADEPAVGGLKKTQLAELLKQSLEEQGANLGVEEDTRRSNPVNEKDVVRAIDAAKAARKAQRKLDKARNKSKATETAEYEPDRGEELPVSRDIVDEAALNQYPVHDKGASPVIKVSQGHNVETMAGKDESKRSRKAEKAERKHLKALENSGPTQAQVPVSNATINGVNGSMAESIYASNGIDTSAPGYVEDPLLTALPQANIDSYLTTNHISIADPSTTVPLRPITSFSYLPLSCTSDNSAFASFKTPTPIQAASWPFLFSNRDVIGVAETGSGKTLAFGIPCIRALTNTKIVIYGGVPKDAQRSALQTANIIVATPGRLNDLLSESAVSLSAIHYLVLDEADRMLDTGFEQDIRKIISQCPSSSAGRQTLMFTATWPPSVRELASTFLTSPVRIAIGKDNPTGELRANARITQKVEVTEPEAKQTRMLQLIKQYQGGPKNKNDRILLFCLYKKEAVRVEGFLRSKGLRVAAIHGDMSQDKRLASLGAFKSGSCPLLVATDVAARGLDIPNVKLVLNLTFPLTVEDYVHRIGRTGRAGAEGLAITLFTIHDKPQSGALINVLRAAEQHVPEELLKFGTTVKKKEHDLYGAFTKDVKEGAPTKGTKIRFD